MGNIDKAIYYATRSVEHVRQFKALALPNTLLNLGSLYSEYDFFAEAEVTLQEGLDLAKRMGQEVVRDIFYGELGALALHKGEIAKCLDYLSLIPIEQKTGNLQLAGFVLATRAEAAVAERRTPDPSFMYELQEFHRKFVSIPVFYALAWMQRRMQPTKPNFFVETRWQDIIDDPTGETKFLANLVYQSERLRVDSSALSAWEEAAYQYASAPEIGTNEPSYGGTLYVLEVIQRLPDLAQVVMSKAFRRGTHVLLNYLRHDWDSYCCATKITLIEHVCGKLASPYVAKELCEILRIHDIEREVLESTRVVELVAQSEHLSEDDVGPLLLKYRTLAENAEEALRRYSTRDPEPLRIYMFGKFEIWKGAKRIEFAKDVTQPMLSVLKLLLRKRDEVISLDALADSVWKDIGTKQAKNNVYTAISQLRTALEPYLISGKDSHFIKAAERGYMFAHRIADTVDCEDFESFVAAASKQRGERAAQTLIQAVKLYRGPYLEENVYDEWADNDRQYFRQLYVRSLQVIVTWYRKVNAWDEVELYGNKGFALEPENVDFCGALLECAGARREMYSLKKVYSEHEHALNEVFGDAPSKGIRELYQSCLDKL